MKNRRFLTKAQGMSLNTIVIAAIVIIVLVVLVAIFTGRMGPWVQSVENCQDKNGACVDSSADCVAPNAVIRGTNCDRDEKVCCVQIVKE